MSNVRGAIHDLVGGALGRPNRGRTLYGNETVTNQEVVTKWDQQRYAIGIRDIGIWRYEFAEQSEMISIPFRSPQPIRSLSLEVDEVIPIQFNEGDDIRSWINYYVAIGDSQEWQPIAPTSARVVRSLEGGQIPAVIHVNAGIPIAERNPGEGYIDTDAPVFQVRFRAVLARPTNLQDATSFTPALKAYRLLMTTTGGER